MKLKAKVLLATFLIIQKDQNEKKIVFSEQEKISKDEEVCEWELHKKLIDEIFFEKVSTFTFTLYQKEKLLDSSAKAEIQKHPACRHWLFEKVVQN